MMAKKPRHELVEVAHPEVTPPERPLAKTHENPKATRCEVCGTVGSAPVCEVDGWPR